MREAVGLLRGARTVALAAHRDPDGDTIGSAIALGLGLEGAGKRITLHCADAVPDSFRFLPSTARFRTDAPAAVDLVVTVDYGDAARGKFDLRGLPLLNIDHHATNAGFGTVNLVETDSPATAEIVARLIDAAGLGWTSEMATAALLGIMTDTGSFQFPNTNPECLRRAAQLLQAGADLVAITTNVFRARPYPAFKVFGKAFARLERECDGRLVHTWIDRHDVAEAGATPADTTGLVEQVARTIGMRVAVLLSEDAPGQVKLSIRTSALPPAVDAAAIAQRFGGGGHARAAGAIATGSLDEVRLEVLAAARAALA